MCTARRGAKEAQQHVPRPCAALTCMDDERSFRLIAKRGVEQSKRRCYNRYPAHPCAADADLPSSCLGPTFVMEITVLNEFSFGRMTGSTWFWSSPLIHGSWKTWLHGATTLSACSTQGWAQPSSIVVGRGNR